MGRKSKARGLRFCEDGAFEVELSQGQWAKVSPGDLPVVLEYKWSVSPNPMGGYYATVSQNVAPTTRYMHRLILGATKGQEVDHINHDTLDNRRENLRIVTHSANLLNRKGANRNSATGIRGVYIHKIKSGTYYNVRIMLNGKSKTKNFPYTEWGLGQATAYSLQMQANPAESFLVPRNAEYIKSRRK